jgi:DNA polymerase III epsilon subunit-like protein
MNYELYVLDTETTGISAVDHSPVEISIHRLATSEQKTWHLKPINMDTIQAAALRVNGLKMEDLKGLTKEGRELYREPAKVLVEIENWIMEDGSRSEDRFIVGHNAYFDLQMLIHLWDKCNSPGTFPWNPRRCLDTMGLEFAIDLCRGKFAQGYALANLTKKYGVINSKAHSAAADVAATVAVFKAQVGLLGDAFALLDHNQQGGDAELNDLIKWANGKPA